MLAFAIFWIIMLVFQTFRRFLKNDGESNYKLMFLLTIPEYREFLVIWI